MKNIAYVDTHCHLDLIYKRLRVKTSTPMKDLEVEWPKGLDGVVNVYGDSFQSTMPFFNMNDSRIHGALGIHPHNANSYTEETERDLRMYLKHNQIVALGEIGLDYHYNHSPPDIQRAVFEKQASIAVELGLPIVIHTREAEHDTWEIINRVIPKNHRIHIHCYTSSKDFAVNVMKDYPNAFFGFTGVITFNSSDSVRDVCRIIPIDRILSETDGPYMAPQPYRGKVAVPGHIPTIIQTIASLHDTTFNDTASILRENCRRMYQF